MSVTIISDLHIWGPDDPFYRSLLTLIQTQTNSGETLILAGDIFDLFVGNKSIFKARYAEFFKCLESISKKGVKIHYIEGNHDFLLQKAFQEIEGLSVHSHDVSIEVQGKRFFIAHGDTVDPTDYGYQLLRMILRSSLARMIFWLVPGSWVDRFGHWSSRRSRTKGTHLLSRSPIQRREVLRKFYRSFAAEKLAEGYDFVALGHCHDLDEKFFQIGGRPGQYVNVGYPRVHGSYLTWTMNEDKIQREKLP